jgi:hypothetical protein
MKAQPESFSSHPGPSRTVDQRIQVDSPTPKQPVGSEDFAMTEGDSTTSGDPTATNPRFFTDEMLTVIARDVMKLLYKHPDDPDLAIIHWFLLGHFSDGTGVPKGFVSQEVLAKNINGRDVSDVVELAKKAVKSKTNEDWKDVIAHGMDLTL